MRLPVKYILLAVLTALIVTATAASAPDPRVCTYGKALQCGKDYTQTVLIGYMGAKLNDPNWGAVITCRAYTGLLRYRCSYRNGLGSGSALIVYAPKTFKPTVTITPTAPPSTTTS
jgi:hypothetical protein